MTRCRLLLLTTLTAAFAAAAAPAPLRVLSAYQDDNQPPFSQWLEQLRADAAARGIRPEVLDAALEGVEAPLSVVIERDRGQAEVVLPLETYISRRMSAKTLRSARQMFTTHKGLLEKVSARYDVPARVILSIWGIESNFGRFTGVRPTIAALATLAWDPRRSAMFRGELLDALEILNRGDVELPKLRGSWAGAMGQPQFMPSSYLQFAEDFDGDGRKDIWRTRADVFASVANYLKGHGWVAGQRWGREVAVTPEAAERIASTVGRRAGTCQATRNMTVALPLAEWRSLGVHAKGGAPLPNADQQASLVAGASRYFLVYGNYDVLLSYNCAHAYALSVGLLADSIR